MTVDFEALRAHLPVSDPDRHDLDTTDATFAHLAPGYPADWDEDAETEVAWHDLGWDVDDEPEPERPVTDVPTRGLL
jgi:hypothetical protein